MSHHLLFLLCNFVVYLDDSSNAHHLRRRSLQVDTRIFHIRKIKDIKDYGE